MWVPGLQGHGNGCWLGGGVQSCDPVLSLYTCTVIEARAGYQCGSWG